MFKNKHVMTSMIVAPILAILSYFATDYIVSDMPTAAESGKSYSLLARPNCRYQSGHCTLVNGDLEVRLKLLELDSGKTVLQATSSVPLKGARIAMVGIETVSPPHALKQVDDKGEAWRLSVTAETLASAELRIAMLADETIFYGNTETTFFHYETGFETENWL